MLNLTSQRKPNCLVKTSYLSKPQLSYAWEEIKKRKHSYSRDGYDGRKTIRDNFDPRYCGTQFITEPRSFLRSLWNVHFWNQFTDILSEHEDNAFVHSVYTQHGQVLLSAYGNGDSYGFHVDVDMGSILTAVLFLNFGKPFKGGDFLLHDVTIPFEHNKLIIFPSCIPHAVTKIETDSKEYHDMRFSLQYFISAVPFKKSLIDESSNIQ